MDCILIIALVPPEKYFSMFFLSFLILNSVWIKGARESSWLCRCDFGHICVSVKLFWKCREGLKKSLEFKCCFLETSISQIFLAWGHFLLVLVNDFVGGWLARSKLSFKDFLPARKSIWSGLLGRIFVEPCAERKEAVVNLLLYCLFYL